MGTGESTGVSFGSIWVISVIVWWSSDRGELDKDSLFWALGALHMGKAGDRGAWHSSVGSSGTVLARPSSFVGDSGNWGHGMVASDSYDVKQGVRGVNGFFDHEYFPHRRIWISPPPTGGVVGVDVEMGSVHLGRRVKPTFALPRATSLLGRFWR